MPTYSFLPFLRDVPIGTRILTGTLVIFSLLHQVLLHLGNDATSTPVSKLVRRALGEAAVGAYETPGQFQSMDTPPYLVVVPGKSLWFPWTFLTAGWVETNIIQVCVNPFPKPASC